MKNEHTIKSKLGFTHENQMFYTSSEMKTIDKVLPLADNCVFQFHCPRKNCHIIYQPRKINITYTSEHTRTDTRTHIHT